MADWIAFLPEWVVLVLEPRFSSVIVFAISFAVAWAVKRKWAYLFWLIWAAIFLALAVWMYVVPLSGEMAMAMPWIVYVDAPHFLLVTWFGRCIGTLSRKYSPERWIEIDD
jgi:hypothetical protein